MQLDGFPGAANVARINLGLVRLTPSAETLRAVLAAMASYARFCRERGMDERGACDELSLDQGLLNFFFRHSTTLLPATFLLFPTAGAEPDPMFVDPRGCALRPHVSGLHFVGSPKPWAVASGSSWLAAHDAFVAADRAAAVGAAPQPCTAMPARAWWRAFGEAAAADGVRGLLAEPIAGQGG